MATQHEKAVRWALFAVGVICFSLAAGLALWAFNITELSVDQRLILLWALPLASGFAAGSFTGSVTVNGQLKSGLTVGAVGGFAVWLITFWFWLPHTYEENTESNRTTTEKELLAYIDKLQPIQTKFEQIDDYGEPLRIEVLTSAENLGDDLLKLDDSKLDYLHLVAKKQAVALSYIIAATLQQRDREKRLEFATTAYKSAAEASQIIMQIDNLANQMTKPDMVKAAKSIKDFLRDDNSLDKSHYYMAIALAIKAREHDGTTVDDVFENLEKLNSGFRQKNQRANGTEGNDFLRWAQSEENRRNP